MAVFLVLPPLLFHLGDVHEALPALGRVPGSEVHLAQSSILPTWREEAPPSLETQAQQVLYMGPAVILHPGARHQLLSLASEDGAGVAGGRPSCADTTGWVWRSVLKAPELN